MQNLGDKILFLLGVAGSIASLYGLGSYFDKVQSSEAVAAIIFLGIFSLFFLLYSLHLLYKGNKTSSYLNLYENLNEGFAKIHEIKRDDGMSKVDIITRLNVMCNVLASSFSEINEHQIGVTIKIIYEADGKPAVLTACRDEKSKFKGRTIDYDIPSKPNLIEANSDFDFLYNIEEDEEPPLFYYETHLHRKLKYRNSRLKPTWYRRKDVSLRPLRNFNRKREWKLKYKCSLVVPIRPLSLDNTQENALRGFLILDSPQNKAFDKKRDSNILRGICDGMCYSIDLLNKKYSLGEETLDLNSANTVDSPIAQENTVLPNNLNDGESK